MSVEATSAGSSAGIDPSRARIAGAIQQAAGVTGTSFQYLLTTAKMESDFSPSAQASTSSARGLYQFIDQTWLGTVKEAGGALGYGQYADAITRSPSGSYSVSDPATRRAILSLRDDPAASSAMAGVLTRSNSFKLTGKIGRRPTDSELYMAHFMGVGGAAKLITNAEDNPKASGARLFPNAAAANRSIFYERGGRARSVSEVYSVLNARYASAATSQATRSVMASVGSAPSATATATAAPVDNAAYLASFPDVRAVTPAAASTDIATKTAALQNEPIFRTLFHAGDRSEPVSPAVHELWHSGASSTSSETVTTPVSATTPTLQVETTRPFDLFSDRPGAFSS